MIWKSGIAGLILALTVVGCSNENQDQLNQKTDQAKQAIQSGADKTKVAADSDLESAKVAGALKAAADLSTDDIHVESDSVAKTVTLNGSVPTKAQHEQALKVAKGIAGTNYAVVDKLEVKEKKG